jgi:hypothetical protein
VHVQTLLAHILDKDAPLSIRSPPRRSCTGSRRRSGCYHPLVAPPTARLHTTTNHQRPHTPFLAQDRAFRKDNDATGAAVAQSKIWAFTQGGRGRERGKTNHDGASKEVDDAKWHRYLRDRPTGLRFLPVVEPIANTPAKSRARRTRHRSGGVGRIWEREGLVLRI